MRRASRKNCEVKSNLRKAAISASEQKPACDAFMARSTLCDSFRMAPTSLSNCTPSCPNLPSADSSTTTAPSRNVASIPHSAATNVAASVKTTRCLNVRIISYYRHETLVGPIWDKLPAKSGYSPFGGTINSAFGTHSQNHSGTPQEPDAQISVSEPTIAPPHRRQSAWGGAIPPRP